jgi:hypothetical protein
MWMGALALDAAVQGELAWHPTEADAVKLAVIVVAAAFPSLVLASTRWRRQRPRAALLWLSWVLLGYVSAVGPQWGAGPTLGLTFPVVWAILGFGVAIVHVRRWLLDGERPTTRRASPLHSPRAAAPPVKSGPAANGAIFPVSSRSRMGA